MENLKAIIVFLLFWSIAIWCVRVVKRKHKKQIMKFSEELPEMELVTDEEERKYIYQSINGSGKFLTTGLTCATVRSCAATTGSRARCPTPRRSSGSTARWPV